MGELVGARVGASVGGVGAFVGASVGASVGGVGALVGASVGELVGVAVGASVGGVGALVGLRVGALVGDGTKLQLKRIRDPIDPVPESDKISPDIPPDVEKVELSK